MSKYRFHFISATCCGVGVLVLNWLLFRYYPPASPAILQILQNAFANINIIPLELSAHSQNHGFHPPFVALVFFVLMFVQWFAAGFALSFLFRRRAYIS